MKKLIDETRIKLCKSIIDLSYGVLATGITSITLLIALVYGQMLFGRYTFIVSDLYYQCAPFAHLFINKLKEGSNLYYSFNAGLGMNTSLLFAFYVCSPFNLLYFFSNGSNINNIAIVIFVLKAGMAAFSFQRYSKYNLKVDGLFSSLLATGYALVSYGIGSANMTALYDGVYLLPLILIAIKKMIDKKRNICLIVLYTVLFLSNFYSGYIVGVASFVYFIVVLILSCKEYKEIISIFVKYCLCVLCALSLSAFLLFPALYEALSQGAIDSEFIFSATHVWNMASYLFPFHKRELYGLNPCYYCGLPSMILASSFFANKLIKRKYKVVCGLAVMAAIMSMLFKPIYSLAHMFNNPNGYTYRYIYIVSFIIVNMAIISWKYFEGVDVKKTLIIITCLFLLHCFAPAANRIMGINDNSPKFVFYIVTFGLLVGWMFLIWRYSKVFSACRANDGRILKILATMAIIMLVVETCFNSYTILTSERRQLRAEYKYRVQQASRLTESLSKMDNSIYRVYYDWLDNPNQACLYGYYGTNLFASSGNSSLKEFLYKIGLQCEKYYMSDNGSTELTRLLLDEKYELIAHVDCGNPQENYINEVSTAGFGFMVNEDARNICLDSNVFENQNNIYSILMNEEVQPFKLYDGEVNITGENVNLYVDDSNIVSFELEEYADVGAVAIKLPSDGEGDRKIWLSMGDNRVNHNSPVIISDDLTNGTGYMEHLLSTPHIVSMSQEDDLYVVYIVLAKDVVGEGWITECCFASYDGECIERLIDRLSHQSFNTTSFRDGYVSGNISVSEPGVCFLSIPYEDGWNVTIDGNRGDIVSLFNGAFIGVPVASGYHEVELWFEAPYSKLGEIVSLFGLALFIGIFIMDYMGAKRIKTARLFLFK